MAFKFNPITATLDLVSDVNYPVTSVSGRTGAITLTKSDVGLSDVDNTSDANKPVSTAQATANSGVASTAASNLATHTGNVSNPHAVTKTQVGLSNVPNTDFTAAVAANTAKISYTDAAKVAGIATGATANDTDANLEARANHTGTQTADTISDFADAVVSNTALKAPIESPTFTGVVTTNRLVKINTTTGNPEFDFQVAGVTASKTYWDVANNRLTFQNTTNNNADALYFADSITGTGAAAFAGAVTGSNLSGTNTGDISLTTTGTSGAATLVGATLNVPQYSGGVTSVNTRTGAVTGLAEDSAVVHNTGTETVAGEKNFTTSLGSSGSYVPATYTQNLYLNSTAYLGGSTAGVIGLNANSLTIAGTGSSALTSNINGIVTDGSGLAVFQSSGYALGEYAGAWKSDYSVGVLAVRRGFLTAASGHLQYGVNSYTYFASNDASGVVIAVNGKAEAYGSGGGRSLLSAIGVQAQVQGGSTGFGTVTNAIGFNVSYPNSYSGVTNVYGIKMDTPAIGTNRYGIYLNDVSGGTTNYALYTNAGAVRFGDMVTMVNGLTLPSTATDIAHYNTSDQTTNYERVRQYWNSNVYNIAIEAAGTGTQRGLVIGTATTQKIGLWNATPVVQPTTGVTAATFVANTSGTINDSATYGGYTIGQVVAALKSIGALA